MIEKNIKWRYISRREFKELLPVVLEKNKKVLEYLKDK